MFYIFCQIFRKKVCMLNDFWLNKGLNESSEEIDAEVLFLGRGWFWLFLFLFLFGFGFLLLLLGGFLSRGGRFACSGSTNGYFGESFADKLNDILITSSPFLLFTDLRTSSTCFSSTGLPVALRIARTESLAE